MARVSRVLPGWSVEQAKRMGASAAKLLVYYHHEASNVADQERFVAEVAGACRAADLPLFVEPLGFDPGSGGKLDRRGAASQRDRDGTPPHGDRRGRAEGRVPVRRVGHGSRRVGGRVHGAGRRQPPARGCCCRAEWTTRRSSARSPRRATPARRGCSSAAPCGRRPRPWPRTIATAWLASEGRRRLERLVRLVDERGTPWHARPNSLSDVPAPGDGWYREYGAAR